MLRIRFTLIAMTTVLILTIGLGALAGLTEKQREGNEELAVFTPSSKGVHLEQTRIVDQLQHVPSTLPIRRVIWQDSGRLSVDIRVASTIRSKTILYEELYRWLQFAFRETDNIQRLQLRITMEEKRMKKKYVLAAIDVSRGAVEESVWRELKDSSSGLSKQTEDALRLTYTPLWKQIFAVPVS